MRMRAAAVAVAAVMAADIAAAVVGSFTVASDLETLCVADDTWYLAGSDAGATVAGSVMEDVAHVSPGRLTYTGASAVAVLATFAGSVSAAGSMALSTAQIRQRQFISLSHVRSATPVGFAVVPGSTFSR